LLTLTIATPKNYLAKVKTLSAQATNNGEQPKGKRHVDTVAEGLKTFPYWMLFFITMTTSCKQKFFFVEANLLNLFSLWIVVE